MSGGTYKAAHPANFSIKTSRVNGARRIEIAGADPARIPGLKVLGCFTEIIAYKTRVFVPLDGADDIIASIVAT